MDRLAEELITLVKLRKEAKDKNAHPEIQKRIQNNVTKKMAEIMDKGLTEKIRKELETLKGKSNV